MRVGLARNADHARLTVANARRPGLRGEKTTGLGMFIIQTIVGLHQGRNWFESTEGQGTTVFVAVPALPV